MKIFKKISEIFRKVVIGYVFYTFPLTLIAFAIIPKPPSAGTEEIMIWLVNVIFSNTLYIIAMAQILIWPLVSFLYSVSMLFFRNNREIFIKKLSGIKERDEREVQIIGKAFRASYLTTMTILLFLLFISLLRLGVGVKTFDNPEPGEPQGFLEIGGGIGYETLDPDAIITQREGYDFIFEYNGLPLSTSAVILVLLVWQIVSFRFVSRRALRVPD